MVFIAGNMPMVSEITPLLIMIKLEQFDYAGATAIALVFLIVSFAMLLTVNALARRARGAPADALRRHEPRSPPPPRAIATKAARVRVALIGIALTFLVLFLFLPLVGGVRQGVREGRCGLRRGDRRSHGAGGDPPRR